MLGHSHSLQVPQGSVGLTCTHIICLLCRARSPQTAGSIGLCLSCLPLPPALAKRIVTMITVLIGLRLSARPSNTPKRYFVVYSSVRGILSFRDVSSELSMEERGDNHDGRTVRTHEARTMRVGEHKTRLFGGRSGNC